MGGDRGKKRQRRDSDEQPSESAAAAGSNGGRRLFRRGAKKQSGGKGDESVLSADAAAKMAERKAQRENLRALRERKLSEVEPPGSGPAPAAARRSSRRSAGAQKPASTAATAATAAASAAAASADARSTPLLLILRGPAAAGKSTIAQGVVDTLRRAGRSVCLLEQDYMRNTALGSGPNSAIASAKMLKGCADAALECGYDVVLEGILNSDPAKGGQYRPLLAGLAARSKEPAGSAFGANVGLFYLDVPLKTTKLRHSKRAKAAEFGTEMLDKWWKFSQPSGLAGEVTLRGVKGGGEAGVVGSVSEVLSHVGLDPNGQPL
jgi:thymidylate kinase